MTEWQFMKWLKANYYRKPSANLTIAKDMATIQKPDQPPNETYKELMMNYKKHIEAIEREIEYRKVIQTNTPEEK